VNLKSFQISTTQLTRSIFVSLLTLAAAATASQPEQAAAVDLNFNTIDTALDTTTNTNFFNFGFGPGVTSNVIHYKNVASGVDATVTAGFFGTGYSLAEHIYNYSANTAGQPTGDAAFLYQMAANQTGKGGMTYKMDFWNSGSNYSTAYTAPDLRFLVYDVDGEPTQGEALRIAKGSGLVGYQVGSSAAALIPTEDANSYLFSGRNVNQPENDTSGAAILYFQNVNSVTFQFEANTLTASTSANPVFSAIDGDLSLIGQNTSLGFAGLVNTSASATSVPEPFTIIGSLIGGTAAFRMRKKLKSTNKA
jgi:hypothetical protein